MSWLPRRPLALPGPPRKFEKKKFYGRMEGAGAAPGKGRAGGTAAGGREGRRRRRDCRAAEPCPRALSTCLPPAPAAPGRRHDGECPPGQPLHTSGQGESDRLARPLPSRAAPSSLPGGEGRSPLEDWATPVAGPAILPHVSSAYSSPFPARSPGDPAYTGTPRHGHPRPHFCGTSRGPIQGGPFPPLVQLS